MGRVPIGLATICCLIPYVLGCHSLDVSPVTDGDELALDKPARTSEGYYFSSTRTIVGSTEVPAAKEVVDSQKASCPATEEAQQGHHGAPGLGARCRAKLAQLHDRLFAGCQIGARPPGEEIEHIHPRFFPVPTRPVFWPRRVEPPPIAGGPFPERPWAASAPAQPAVPAIDGNAPVAPIHIHVPEPDPDQIPATPAGKRDRVTQAPRTLSVADDTTSWLFHGRDESEPLRPVVGQAERKPSALIMR